MKIIIPDSALHEECVGCYNFFSGYVIRLDYCFMECVSYSYTDKTGKDHFNKQFTQKCKGHNWKKYNVLWNKSLRKCVVEL